jgi:hypothetical protein
MLTNIPHQSPQRQRHVTNNVNMTELIRTKHCKILLTTQDFHAQNPPKPFTLLVVDWAGFEPATFRLRIERSYQTELPALLSDNGMLEG